MTIISSSKLLPYSAKEIFCVVADIKQYPIILKHIKAITVNHQEDNLINATVNLSCRLFSLKYDCDITLSRYNKITTCATEGSFKHLNAEWIFESINDNSTLVRYNLDFKIRSLSAQLIASSFVAQNTQPTIKHFESYLRNKFKM